MATTDKPDAGTIDSATGKPAPADPRDQTIASAADAARTDQTIASRRGGAVPEPLAPDLAIGSSAPPRVMPSTPPPVVVTVDSLPPQPKTANIVRGAVTVATGAGVVAVDEGPDAAQTIGTPPGTSLVRAIDTTRSESRHDITRFLAEGGIGKVFVARDGQLNREVVLKTLKPEAVLTADARRRFLKEAQVNAQLEHPNIVPIYQAGRDPDDGHPFYTMKFIRGRDLADCIQAYHFDRRAGIDSAIAFRRLLSLFVSTCYAISYAHNRRIAHRDLKPANIAVGEFGELMVLDWGLAKLLDCPDDADVSEERREIALSDDADTDRTVKGRIMGTPAYMAPEQAAGRTEVVGAAADIYALGGILFEILTGEPPHKLLQRYEPDKLERLSRQPRMSSIVTQITRHHQSSLRPPSLASIAGQVRENTMDMLARIISGAIPMPRDIDPMVPRPLEAIAAKAMQLVPSDRYRDASEIAEDVSRWLADEPIAVYHDTRQERLGRWMRKNRTKVQAGVASLAAVVVVALVAGLAINQARKAEKQQKENVGDLLRQSRDQIGGLMNDTVRITDDFPNFSTQAQKLLGGRVREYEKLRERIQNQMLAQGDSPLLRAELGRLNLQLGFVHHQLGDFAAAEQAQLAGERLWTRLHADYPDVYNYAVNLAKTLNNLGDRYIETAQPSAKVLDHYDRAIAILRRPGPPGDPYLDDGREALGQVLLARARLMTHLRRFDEVEKSLDDAAEVFRKLVSDRPQELRYLLHVAKTANRQMVLWTDRGQADRAASFADETLAPIEARILQHSAIDSMRSDALGVLASSAIDRGNALRPLGFDAEALAAYDLGVTHLESLVEESGNSPGHLINLAAGNLDLALLLHDLGDTPAAREGLAEAIRRAGEAYSYWPSADYLQLQVRSVSGRGRVLSELNQDTDAIEHFQEAIRACEQDLLPQYLSDDPRRKAVIRQRAISRGGLARVFRNNGQFDEAAREIDLALQDWESQMPAGEAATLNDLAGLAGLLINRGDLLHAQSKPEAADAYGLARAQLEEAVRRFADVPDASARLAALLTHCADPSLRDIELAARLAQSAVNRAPRNARYRSTLALALYRAGKWDQAVAAAESAAQLRLPIRDAADHFVLAMARARRNHDGDRELAAKSLDEAKSLFDQLRPGNTEYARLHDEAQRLIHEAQRE
jgi:serine/threonine protein kinase